MKNIFIRIILAVLISSVITFFWTNISWMKIGWHQLDMYTLPNYEEVFEKLPINTMKHGVYHVPGFPEDKSKEAQEKWVDRFIEGPNINFMVIDPDGNAPMSPLNFILGFGIYLFTNSIIALILFLGLNSFGNKYFIKVLIAFVIGAAAALLGPVTNFTWWNYPPLFTLINIIDTLITWTIAGFILAFFIKPVKK